ncbi:type II toxin-antitoxin system RelE/ParE family toxin [Geotoga petraea]|uniref:Proteic killer suppression protein n=1 Tax=Geotoga petraea TaxID=28234 RepID=A0A1G6QCQ9_9BACT|nr:type II toxin-antitoxin system RelE/ParE family toxin [Geotoga petraea]SDC89455.1 proteic killer suppression protein [Geotoga petraea]
MDIIYKNKQIKKICTNFKKSKIQIGDNASEKLFAVINFIENAKSFKDVENMPRSFRFHKLTGDRKGTYFISLGKTKYRLIIEPLDENEKEIKTNDDKVINEITKMVIILEVSDHYE